MNRRTRARGSGTGAVVRRGSSGAPPSTPSESTSVFRCHECLHSFHTWSKLTNHLEQSSHFLASCAVCGEQLKCYGPNQPHRHEVSTGHRGFLGVFYTRDDYRIDHPPVLSHAQYRCHCRVAFTDPLHIALHLRNDHGVDSIPDMARCLTCDVEGTLDEMVQHRMERFNEKKKDQFEIPGFVASRYLMPCPRRASHSAEGTDYTILYQCPVCLLVFASWSLMQKHMTVTGHGHRHGTLPPVATPYNLELGDAGDSEFSRRELEALVNMKDPEISALIQHSLVEDGDARDDDIVFGYQCPEESCARLFLSHGELFEHMEKKRHFPHNENAETDATSPTVSKWKCDAAVYEVQCSNTQLIEVFGFSKCVYCHLAVTPGAEQEHHQLYHPTSENRTLPLPSNCKHDEP